MGTVVVIGATSYIGGFVIPELLERGHRVVGITRRPEFARILLPEGLQGLAVAQPEEAMRLVQGEEISVINFAYIRDAAPQLVYRQNKQLIESIRRLAADRCHRLVEISTQSVFNDVFEAPPVAKRLPWGAKDSVYGESKLHAEHLMERLATKLDCELAIVRLGCVIGPGAPRWVAGIAQRIMEMKPVGYKGEAGYSNTAYVKNIASYVCHLIERPADGSPGPGVYHHLAEFSSRRWPELLDVYSAAIGCEWTTAPRPAEDLSRPSRVRGALKTVYSGRAGAYVRAGWGLLPAWDPLDRAIAGTREASKPRVGLSADDPASMDGVLDILASEHEFRSAIVGGWEPPHSFEMACAEITDWLGAWGFRLQREPAG
jgi:nucleoside-diphosphate-sugar epimerase